MSAPIPEASGSPEPSTNGPSAVVGGVRFAHASEAEMARILDFYDVRWHYEPTTFPILWNLDGDVVESFAPDFYLPDLDVFLEMTTLKQRLVRKKNRKLRRLRELYPDIRIKLFYARDFRAMMLKYGRLGLVESLSGTSGQVVPERPAEATPVGAINVAADVPAEGVPALGADPAVEPAVVAGAALDSVPTVPAVEPQPDVVAAADPLAVGTLRRRAKPRPSSRRRRRAARWAEAAAERERGA